MKKHRFITNKVIGDPLVHRSGLGTTRRDGVVCRISALSTESSRLGSVALFARHPLTEMCLQTLKDRESMKLRWASIENARKPHCEKVKINWPGFWNVRWTPL